MRNTVASGVLKYAANSRLVMAQVLRSSSAMARPIVGGGDLAENFIETAALYHHFLRLDQSRADQGGKLGCRGGTIAGRRLQADLAVGATDGFDAGNRREVQQRLLDSFNAARGNVH